MDASGGDERQRLLQVAEGGHTWWEYWRRYPLGFRIRARGLSAPRRLARNARTPEEMAVFAGLLSQMRYHSFAIAAGAGIVAITITRAILDALRSGPSFPDPLGELLIPLPLLGAFIGLRIERSRRVRIIEESRAGLLDRLHAAIASHSDAQ